MDNNEISLMKLSIEFKWICIIIMLIFLSKLIKICWKNSPREEDLIKFESLSKEEQQLYLITKFNTKINKINIKEKEKYVKKCNIIYLNF